MQLPQITPWSGGAGGLGSGRSRLNFPFSGAVLLCSVLGIYPAPATDSGSTAFTSRHLQRPAWFHARFHRRGRGRKDVAHSGLFQRDISHAVYVTHCQFSCLQGHARVGKGYAVTLLATAILFKFRTSEASSVSVPDIVRCVLYPPMAFPPLTL